MKVTYEIDLKIKIHDVIKSVTEIKDGHEIGESIAHMIMDELTFPDTYAEYDLIETRIDAK